MDAAAAGTERRGPFRDQIGEAEQVGRDVVEEQVELDEVGPLHVPMRVLHLREEVRGVGELPVQQIHQLAASVFRDVDPRLVEFGHGSSSRSLFLRG